MLGQVPRYGETVNLDRESRVEFSVRSRHLQDTSGLRARSHEWLHRTTVLNRRTQRLVVALDQIIPGGSSVLDVGCGNGEIGAAIGGNAKRSVLGIETRPRSSCKIPSVVYDGFDLPVKTKSVDWVMFVDVLHHVVDPAHVLADACRVARDGLIIKDHYGDTGWARGVLRVMDWFGNRHLNVDLQANYLSREQWATLWEGNQLHVDALSESLDLYPGFAKPLFENGLHFVARLATGH